MDKQTLSNYGWIVIAVLVLVVMIALATPFGTFVSEAIQSTTKGLFDVNKNALDAAGVPGLTVQDQEFDVPDMNHGASQTKVAGATFYAAFKDTSCHQYEYQHTASCYTEETVTLSWEELKLAENGAKYGYDASAITDTSIGEDAFSHCDLLTSIDLPDGITSIGDYAFAYCYSSIKSIHIPNSVTSIGDYVFERNHHTTINYAGSMEEWGNITLGEYWRFSSSIQHIICNDGTITR